MEKSKLFLTFVFMEEKGQYISVILPLKLEWEPCYKTVTEEVEIGARVAVTFAGRRYSGVVSDVHVTPVTNPERIRPVDSFLSDLPAVSETEIRFWRRVAEYYLCTVGEVFKAAYPSEKQSGEQMERRQEERLRIRLEAWRSKLDKARTEVTRNRYAGIVAMLERELESAAESPAIYIPIHLTDSQMTALDHVKEVFALGKTALLRGVTGSGKTQIYMALAQKALSEGKSVLYLVPEIALSHQLEERIREVFPQVQVFHSSITPARKRNVAVHCRSGNPYFVLGTRSALFLPHRNLGLIVVDEEHDTSYKQDAPSPRYNGRDVAIMLSRFHGAHVILGSATPSLESIYNASSGIYGLVTLEKRYYEGERPEVRVIDTRAERRKRGMVGCLSRKLLEEMERTLSVKGQVLVLRARRSFAPSVQCSGCGSVVKCPCCNVPMSLHKIGEKEVMICHYCGHTEPYAGQCKKCGGELQPLGSGTQRVEEELRALFPSAVIARLDGDTGDEAAVVRDFSEGRTDILVGTQMVTKGFDFDRLALVAVIHADGLLARPDFRADERALQLLEQFRGRSGRRGEKGLLVIQTDEPDHPVIQALEKSDPGVVGTMLSERRAFSYPPYTRMVAIIVKDSDPARLSSMSAALASELGAIPVSVTGPYAPSVDRIAGQYIRHLRILLQRDRTLKSKKKEIGATVSSFERKNRYAGHIVIDVDPL